MGRVVVPGRVMAATAALTAACGSSMSSPAAPPSGAPAGTQTRAPTPLPEPPPLVAVSEGTRPGAPLHLLRMDGSEVGRVADPGAPVGREDGSRLLFSDGHRLVAVDRDARVRTLATFPSPHSGLAADPGGARWLWAVEDRPAGPTYTTRLFLGGPGAAPALVRTHEEAGRFLVPVAWSPRGPVVQHAPSGVGGVSAFDEDFVFRTSLMDPSSGALTPLTTDSCHFSAAGDDGTVACLVNPASPSGTPTLRLLLPSGGRRDIGLPRGIVDAGRVLFSPSGGRDLLVGGARTVERAQGSPFVYSTYHVDLSSGAVRRFGPDGLRPVARLGDGRLVASRQDATGGPPGTYIVGADGSAASLITPRSGAVAVLP